jgi:glucose-1-phosphate thymidylyltransferase
MYPLTREKAKALLPYRGKPMINHIVDKLPSHVDIIVNVNKKFAPDFYAWKEGQPRKIDICVEDVSSEEQRLGAVGALNYWIGERGLNEDMLVFGSDNYFEFDLNDFIAAFDGRHVLVAVYDVREKSKATQYGVVRVESGRIVELDEKPAIPKSSLVSTACWIVPARVFPLIAEFCRGERKDNLGNLIAYIIGYDEVKAYPFKDTWIDIGNLEIYHSTC